jgi:hypothetical protein
LTIKKHKTSAIEALGLLNHFNMAACRETLTGPLERKEAMCHDCRLTDITGGRIDEFAQN